MSLLVKAHEADWYEASARERVAGLLDPDSFTEFLGPTERAMSPHLAQFNLTGAFDDGVVIGRGKLAGQTVFIAAQEGRFLGGAFGEVHGAKLVGLLRAAHDGVGAGGPIAVLLLLDTGGVRLQEANAGELSISEIINAIVAARLAGIAVVALIGGRAGAFGGGSIIAACCSRVAISEHGRISVSGPEVIETNKGVEEFELEGSRSGLADHRRANAHVDGGRRSLCQRSCSGFPRSRDCAREKSASLHARDARSRATSALRAHQIIRRLSRRAGGLASGWAARSGSHR